MRPFAGRPDEAQLVALRELVPSATAPLALPAHPDRRVTLGTILPGNWPALVRADGEIVLAVQSPSRSGDLSRDLGQALAAALEAEPGAGVESLPVPGPGPDFGDLVAPAELAVTVHPGFDWWVEDAGRADPQIAGSLERANAGIVPTAAVEGLSTGYWCRIGEREHLRWVLPGEEETGLDALARLSHADGLSLGPGTRYLGAFRALGLLIPVWELPVGTGAAGCAAPAAALAARLPGALADPRPLDGAERRIRAGLVGRQVFLR